MLQFLFEAIFLRNIVGLAFCTGVGLTFGFWPAMRASKLNPIDALHYE